MGCSTQSQPSMLKVPGDRGLVGNSTLWAKAHIWGSHMRSMYRPLAACG